jgi:iron complex outermembrane receptor protein
MASRIFKATAISTGVAIALGSAPPTLAQDDEIEEVIVTGSHIRRSEYQGRAPIQIVDAEVIELIGAAQPVDVIKELSVNSGSQFYNETNDRAGSAMFNIRNLGLGSTLTLVNGKRAGIAPVADDTGTDFVDMNQFPLAMIERIDVLTNGASATYGSQAVAGVANIITRKGMEGLEVSAGYQDWAAGESAWNVNLAAGAGFDKGHFNIYATYYEQGNRERSEFSWMQDRLIGQGDITRSRFTSSTGSPGTYTRATIDPVTGEAATVSAPNPDYDPNDPNSGPEFLSAPLNRDPDCVAAGGVVMNPADTGISSTSCRYHFVDQVSVISAEKRAQVFAEFDWEVTDNIKYYNESSFSSNFIRRDNGGATLNTGRANGGGFTIPSDHPFNFFINDPNDPLGLGLVYIGPDDWDEAVHGPQAATLRAVARPLGAEVNNNALTSHIRRQMDYTRMVNGIEWDITDNWFMDASLMWAKSRRTTEDSHTYRSDIFQDQVRDGRWNPFGTALANPTLVSPRDGLSVAGRDPLAQQEWDQWGVSTASVTEIVADAIVSGQLFEFMGNPVGMAVGAQYRDVEYVNRPDSLSAAGGANEQGIEAAVRGTQYVTAYFAEVLMPIGDIGEIQLAVRNEDYGSGVSTTDPKVSFEFGITESFGVRGSWGTSFQAPTVRQTAASSSSGFIDDPASPSGQGGTLVCTSTGLNNNIAITVIGAPDLKPQEADNINLGIMYQGERFRASIDYFIFDYDGLIAPDASPQAIVNAGCPNGDTGLPIIDDPRVIRDAGGQLREVRSQFTNIGSVETDGVDINMDYALELGSGELNLRGAMTYVNKFDVDTDGDGTKDFDGAGNRNFNNSFSTMPQWRGFVGGTYFLNDHVFNATVRYIDGYDNDQSNNAPVDSWTTLDLLYSYTFAGLIGDGDTTFSIGMNNALDEDPPALTRYDSSGNLIQRIDPDSGIYNVGWIDRPGYDDRAGHDLRGRIIFVNFKHAF